MNDQCVGTRIAAFGAGFVIFVNKYSNLILILMSNDKNNASNVFCIHENPKKEVLHKFL